VTEVTLTGKRPRFLVISGLNTHKRTLDHNSEGPRYIEIQNRGDGPLLQIVDVEEQDGQCLWAASVLGRHAQNRKSGCSCCEVRARTMRTHVCARKRVRVRVRAALRAREWPLCMR